MRDDALSRVLSDVFVRKAWNGLRNPQGAGYIGNVAQMDDESALAPGPALVHISPNCKSPELRRVLSSTTPVCKCGRRRMLLPTGEPREFVARETVVLRAGKQLFLGPWGGDRDSAYFRIKLGDSELIVKRDPFGPARGETPVNHLVVADLVVGQTFRLDVLGVDQPIYRISGINPGKPEVIVEVDVATKIIDPRGKGHTCVC